ncbi:hypothetical protein [Mycolicibacterium sp. GF69]|uniref:hypothetical protein n=1 Tax=Mycolicibacterium sp. GF69 TaxID=2267251 RepID=UPI00352A35A3
MRLLTGFLLILPFTDRFSDLDGVMHAARRLSPVGWRSALTPSPPGSRHGSPWRRAGCARRIPVSRSATKPRSPDASY